MSVRQQHKEQRVGVFVDVQNLYYSAKNLYHRKVDFKAVLDEAVKARALIRAIAYTIRADIAEEQAFFEALRNIGYEVKAKDLQVFYGGAKKGDWDIGIAMDMIETAPRLDAVVLVSGDGDFVPLIQHLRRAMGCRAEVMAFGKSTSGKLKEEADQFTDLDLDVQKFLKGEERIEEQPREQIPRVIPTQGVVHAMTSATPPPMRRSLPQRNARTAPRQRDSMRRMPPNTSRPLPLRRNPSESQPGSAEPQYTTLDDY